MADDPLPATFALTCQMQVRQVAPGQIRLRFDLRNNGAQTVHLLRWGTPFEGQWMAPFVRVDTPAGALPYRGARVKRGDPEPEDYLTLAPGQRIRAQLRLEDAYEAAALKQRPLTLHAQWQWHDALAAPQGAPPRPRAAHEGLAQDCGRTSLP
jgi:hypothetical protein